MDHCRIETVLAAFGTIGGALFGFDISSMSAWIGTDQYLDYFHSPGSSQQGCVSYIRLHWVLQGHPVDAVSLDHRFHVRWLLRRGHLCWIHLRPPGSSGFSQG